MHSAPAVSKRGRKRPKFGAKPGIGPIRAGTLRLPRHGGRAARTLRIGVDRVILKGICARDGRIAGAVERWRFGSGASVQPQMPVRMQSGTR